MESSLLKPIYEFLGVATPPEWISFAQKNVATLLLDHAHCEKKAASTALNLIYRYTDNTEQVLKLSKLAREELRHFEQVIAIMKKRGLKYQSLTPSRYAAEIHKHVRTFEPAKQVDHFIIGAFIEARSCERFAAVSTYLDEELKIFYNKLLQSEARHFEHYLEFAKKAEFSKSDIDARVDFFREIEAQLIVSPDPIFRFHSGIPSLT